VSLMLPAPAGVLPIAQPVLRRRVADAGEPARSYGGPDREGRPPTVARGARVPRYWYDDRVGEVDPGGGRLRSVLGIDKSP